MRAGYRPGSQTRAGPGAVESYQMYTAVEQTGQGKFTAIVATNAVAAGPV